MRRHTVEVKDFQGDLFKIRLCACHNKHTNKTIDMMVNPVTQGVWFVFGDQKTNVYTGPDLEEALTLYNKI